MDSLGPRFPDMSAIYDKDLLQLARKSALVNGIPLRKDIYVGLTDPSLETPAETRFLKLIGADAVGMSAILKVIAGVHCGMRACTIVVIANVNLPDCMQKISIEEVVETADSAGALLSDPWEKIITELPGEYCFFTMSYWIRSALTEMGLCLFRWEYFF